MGHMGGAAAIMAELQRVKNAVRKHYKQRGDARCHLDDLLLYREVLGVGVDPYACALPPDPDMLESCKRYIAQRRCPGPNGVLPLPNNMTIEQLTAEVERLHAVEHERDEFKQLLINAAHALCARSTSSAGWRDDGIVARQVRAIEAATGHKFG